MFMTVPGKDGKPKRQSKAKDIMTKKRTSTYDTFVSSMNAQERKAFEQEYRKLLIAELIAAAMELDGVSVRKLVQQIKVNIHYFSNK